MKLLMLYECRISLLKYVVSRCLDPKKGSSATHKVFGRLGNEPDRKHVLRLFFLVAVVLVSPHCLRPRDGCACFVTGQVFQVVSLKIRQFLYLDVFLQSPRRFAWNLQVGLQMIHRPPAV